MGRELSMDSLPTNKGDENMSEANPLEAANPDSLQQLFDKDPLKLTQQDLDAMVAKLRAARANFVKAETAKAANGGKKRSAPAKLSLNDLGI